MTRETFDLNVSSVLHSLTLLLRKLNYPKDVIIPHRICVLALLISFVSLSRPLSFPSSLTEAGSAALLRA